MVSQFSVPSNDNLGKCSMRRYAVLRPKEDALGSIHSLAAV
jgi:hypothetical protein